MCTKCKESHESDCLYEKPASIAYVRHLEKQLKELSKSLEYKKENPNSQNSSSEDNESEKTSKSSNVRCHKKRKITHSKKDEDISASAQLGKAQEIQALKSKSEPIFLDPEFAGSTQEHRLKYFKHLSVKAKGLEQSVLKVLLQTKFSFIPAHIALKCISIYWAWLHPIHLTIHRGAFIQDMALYTSVDTHDSNDCFSLSLLFSIISDALPLLFGIENEMSRIVTEYANSLFEKEMYFPATIASVTAALHRSISAMRKNNTNQCWVFSGIAYRLASDINLSTAPDGLGDDISIAHVEARGRLAWALCYWDQQFSMYFGCLPTIHETPFSLNEYVIDDTGDKELWIAEIDVKGDILLSTDLIQILEFANPSNTYSAFSTKRTRGTAKITVTSSKGKIPLDDTVELENSLEQQKLPYTTASMKFKINLTEILKEGISTLFDLKPNTLVSSSFKLFAPKSPHLTEKQIQKIDECIARLDSLWAEFPLHLKAIDLFPLSAQPSITPTSISNCVQFYSSCVLLYFYVTCFSNPEKTHETAIKEYEKIKLGIECVENVIRILSVFINYFGTNYLNHWYEYGPFICSHYILSLLSLNKVVEPSLKKRAVDLLPALLKFCLNPVYKIPGSDNLVSQIKEAIEVNEVPVPQRQATNETAITDPVQQLPQPVQSALHTQQYPHNVFLPAPLPFNHGVPNRVFPPNQPEAYTIPPPFRQMPQIAPIPPYLVEQIRGGQIQIQQPLQEMINPAVENRQHLQGLTCPIPQPQQNPEESRGHESLLHQNSQVRNYEIQNQQHSQLHPHPLPQEVRSYVAQPQHHPEMGNTEPGMGFQNHNTINMPVHFQIPEPQILNQNLITEASVPINQHSETRHEIPTFGGPHELAAFVPSINTSILQGSEDINHSALPNNPHISSSILRGDAHINPTTLQDGGNLRINPNMLQSGANINTSQMVQTQQQLHPQPPFDSNFEITQDMPAGDPIQQGNINPQSLGLHQPFFEDLVNHPDIDNALDEALENSSNQNQQ